MMDTIMVTRASMPAYEEYIEAIKPLWDSHWITNMGKYHKELECRLEEYLQVSQISLMVNGHMSLEMVIQAMDFPSGGEIITTPFTFISTTHAIIRNGLQPIFCDIKEDYTIDEEKIEALINENTVAIVPVHVYGNICNVEKINEIAKKHNLKVIYDACHAFGEEYNGKSIASFGDASVFSFHATKVYNTIEGGAVVCSSKEMYDKLYNLKNFGIRGQELIEAVGANGKMNEFAAIMGICNLGHVDENIKLRKEKVDLYIHYLKECDGIIIPYFNKAGMKYNYGYFPVRFCSKECRDNIYEKLKDSNILARKYFYPLTSDASCFEGKYKDVELDIARGISDRVLVMPLYPELQNRDIERICNIVKDNVK